MPLLSVLCHLSNCVTWFLAVSSFTRCRHLSYGLPPFLFPSTTTCNIVLVTSSLFRLRTRANHLHPFSHPTPPLLSIGYMCALSRYLHPSHDASFSFLLSIVTVLFMSCAISGVKVVNNSMSTKLLIQRCDECTLCVGRVLRLVYINNTHSLQCYCNLCHTAL